MASLVRVLAACSLTGGALIAALTFLLALAIAGADDGRIEANLRVAAERGVLLDASYPRSPFGHTEHQFDMFTDCVAFGMNLSNREDGLLRRMAESPTAAYQTIEKGPCGNLVERLKSGVVVADSGYMRFWHGYQMYLRPLLSIAPLDLVRRVTAMFFFATLALFGWTLARYFGVLAWPVALVPFFALSDFLTVSAVTTHALSLSLCFASSAAIPLLLRYVRDARSLILPAFAFAAGVLYNYLSFLLNPPLTPALIAFLYIAATPEKRPRELARTVAYALGLAALWFAGFAVAWIAKWLFAALVLGPDAVIRELLSTVDKYESTRERMGVNFLGASRRNALRSWVFFGWLLVSVAVACAAVAWLGYKTGDTRSLALRFGALLTPLAAVVIWVELNSTHSAEHSGFVSRSFVLFAILPLLAALKLWRDARCASQGASRSQTPASSPA